MTNTITIYAVETYNANSFSKKYFTTTEECDAYYDKIKGDFEWSNIKLSIDLEPTAEFLAQYLNATQR